MSILDLNSIKFRAKERGGALDTKDVEILQSIENDNTFSITWSPKHRFIDLLFETDIALPLAKIKRVFQSVETDISQTITPKRIYSIGQNSETDMVNIISWSPKNRFINMINEIDSNFSITSLKTKTINQIIETDIANTIIRSLIVIINQTTETETSQAITWNPKNRFVNINIEIDTAQIINLKGIVTINQAIETDVAQPITVISTGEFLGIENNMWAGNLDGQEFDDSMPI